MKLATELQKRSTGRTVYVLDEPTTGLHFEDIRKLLLVLESLVDKGNTVIVIEHNLDVIKTADWLIDMGPEGGHKGGMVVAVGTPEEIAEVAESHTGEFLRHALELTGPASGRTAATARAAKANGTKTNGTKSAPAAPVKAAPATAAAPPKAAAPGVVGATKTNGTRAASAAKKTPAKKAPAQEGTREEGTRGALNRERGGHWLSARSSGLGRR